MYLSIMAGASQVFLVVRQRHSPHVTTAPALRLRRCDLEIERKVAGDGVAPPDFDITTEAHRYCRLSMAATWGGRDVVGAEFVGVERLGDGEGA